MTFFICKSYSIFVRPIVFNYTRWFAVSIFKLHIIFRRDIIRTYVSFYEFVTFFKRAQCRRGYWVSDKYKERGASSNDDLKITKTKLMSLRSVTRGNTKVCHCVQWIIHRLFDQIFKFRERSNRLLALFSGFDWPQI